MAEKPKILLTNDDGLYSAGLRASYDALKDIGEVFVVAPAVQRSGVGRSISIMEPIRVSKVSANGMVSFAVDGTPTDAVIIGIHEIIGELPDLVVSGINLGENISTEAVTTSGTVGAALEAATQGSAAIAISLEVPDIDKFEFVFKPYNFSLAKTVLRKLAKNILSKGMPEGVDVLNVNVPSKPSGGVEITKLARRLYITRIEERLDPRGRKYYWIDGVEIDDAEEGTDLHALRNGKVSITPLTLDSTARIDFDKLRRWLDE
ncbi:5'/3'-nucleotidase SurE [Archaeoglobus veneficus]|uniref:5'-nucleotidase SurE n=1 Tax=Archaeoglobus veneficus (strain DSM 11195 / SNP6) TaxID=693661 RepID=F2KNC3_ARCVS|nr:5'/3'-nucleotidase SurE [Archaeoglobus veneficus]AEA47325.1 Multifunctional protein surE [Archaeoglobus veneficus SNP6]